MQIRFLGPLGRVTGSCYWLRDATLDVEFLVDCGLMQGEEGQQRWNAGDFPFDPAALDFVLLTHAHVDHSGLLPLLSRKGFRGPVYCTRATQQLAAAMLRDVARQARAPYDPGDVERVRWVELGGKDGRRLGSLVPVHTDVFVSVSRTSHILGSVAVQVVWGPPPGQRAGTRQRSILFTGDVGSNEEGAETQPLLRHRQRPVPSDFAVVESTYGASQHDATARQPEARRECLARHVRETVMDRHGVLVIPAFSVQRTQDLLYDLSVVLARDPELRAAVPVWLDAPLAQDLNEIFLEEFLRRHRSRDRMKPLWLGDQLFRVLGLDPWSMNDVAMLGDMLAQLLRKSHVPDQAAAERRAGQPNPIVSGWRRFHSVVPRGAPPVSFGPEGGVLLTGAGMCDGGPVVRYFEDLLPRETTRVLLPGFVGPDTNGGRLRALAALKIDQRRFVADSLVWHGPDGQEKRLPLAGVRAEIAELGGYSGHADRPSLLAYMRWEGTRGFYRLAPKVFLTHGRPEARRALRAALDAESERLRTERPNDDVDIAVEAPDDPSLWFDLDRGVWQDAGDGGHGQPGPRIEDLQARIHELETVLGLQGRLAKAV